MKGEAVAEVEVVVELGWVAPALFADLSALLLHFSLARSRQPH
jgi:hypothetical protein